MSIIIPYDETIEPIGVGAYITPQGEIIHTNDRHDDFAKLYCLGPDYDYLTGAKQGPLSCSKLPELITKEEYEKQKGKIDVFSSSELGVRDLEKLKMWIQQHHGDEMYCDFLVYALSYDKVERKYSKRITSTAADRHIRFFNYYLMGWTIKNPDEEFFSKVGVVDFEFRDRDFSYRSNEDVDAEEEIIEINSRVPLAKRPLYFK